MGRGVSYSYSAILVLVLYSLLLVSNRSLGFRGGDEGEAKGEGEGAIAMATLGGVRESAGTENSVEVEELARFAVEEHNKKEASPFSSFISLFPSGDIYLDLFPVFALRILILGCVAI